VLAVRQAERDMTITILTPPRLGGPFYWARDLANSLNERGIKSEHVYQMRKLLLSPLYQNADIVHTTVPFPFKLWRKPIVLTIKGDYTIELNIWQRFYPKTIAEAKVITVPSQYLKQKLGLGKAVVIPNALFPERFKPVQHEARDGLNLVSVMNFYFLDKARGLLSIIGTLDKVQSCRFNYTIIGGGQYLETIKHQIGGVRANIRFVGFLPDPRLALATSDIFLYYSLHDNFPNAILEAMACGLPVITNSVGAVAEIIDSGDNGYIAETDEHYLECLLNLMDNPDLRQKIGSKARQTVEEKFNWERVISSYIEIYETMAIASF